MVLSIQFSQLELLTAYPRLYSAACVSSEIVLTDPMVIQGVVRVRL